MNPHRTPCTENADGRADKHRTPCTSRGTSPRARTAPKCFGALFRFVPFLVNSSLDVSVFSTSPTSGTSILTRGRETVVIIASRTPAPHEVTRPRSASGASGRSPSALAERRVRTPELAFPDAELRHVGRLRAAGRAPSIGRPGCPWLRARHCGRDSLGRLLLQPCQSPRNVRAFSKEKRIYGY